VAAVVLQSCISGYYRRHADPAPPPPPPPKCIAAPISDSAGLFNLNTQKPTAPNVQYYAFERVQGAADVLQEFALVTVDNNDERCLLIRGTDLATAKYVTTTKTGPSSISVAPWDGNSSKAIISSVNQHNGVNNGTIVPCTIAGNEVVADSSPVSFDDPFAWDGHPAVSANGMWLVFASNRPGSYNSTDLWYARRNADGSYSSPRPLYGANTYCDEISPSFLPQKEMTLLFSSAGHSTFGGYDAFAAELEQVADSLAVRRIANLGSPINSSYDDIFPSISPNGVDMYIASNRPDGRDPQRRDFDIFVAFQKMSGDMPLARLTGRVVNSQTQQPVVDAEVVARESASRSIYSKTRTNTNGEYTLSVPVSTPVQVTAQSDTLFYDSYTVVVPETAKNTTVERSEPITLSRSFILRINFPTSEWSNPYGATLDSNGIETNRAWQTEIDELAANVTSATSTVRKVILVGHTDDVDTDESNLVLGAQRVNFVIDKLVERGVPRAILEGQTEGEKQLLARRKGENLEMWRKRCRRVELKKVNS
jgi:outer membrane protein OmpA-like peptidoglycan-associated protein